MSTGWIWLSSFLLLPLAGLPLLSHPAFGAFAPLSRAILAGAAGAALVSFSMTAFSLLNVPWNLPALLIASGMLAAILRWTIREEPRSHAEEVKSKPVVVVASALAAAAVLAAFTAAAVGAASSPDLIFFWGAKSQQYAAVRTIDARFLAEPFLQYMHPYYPPLVTNLDALASMAAGRMSWTAAIMVFPLLLAALALGLPGALRTGLSAVNSACTSTLIVCAIAYLGMEADIGGNAEMPLLFFETLAMALLLSPVAARASGQLLAGLLLSGAVCTKVEGFPFTLSAIALFLWVRRGDPAGRLWAAALRLLGPPVVALGSWFVFGAVHDLFQGYAGYGRFWDLHPEHARIVARAVLSALGSTGHGLPYLIPLLCLLAAGRLMCWSAIPLGTAAALIGFLLFTYLHRAEDPSLWISWSAARVFSPVPILFALAATCVREARGGSGRRSPEESRP